MSNSIKRSSQFLFYMMPEEVLQLIDHVCSMDKLFLLADHSEEDAPVVYERMPQFRRVYLCHENWASQVIMRKSSERHFYLDSGVSPVIEFDPCTLHDRKLSRGRIYYRAGYDGRDGWVAFPEELLLLYNTMTRFVKKSILTKDSVWGGYISNGSNQFRQSGGELVQFK